MLALATMGSTEFTATHPSAYDLSHHLFVGLSVRYDCTDDRKSCRNWLWCFNDSVQHSGVRCIHCMEK